MNCSKANAYFIKYVDSCLSEDEVSKLGTHLDECAVCNKDFEVYREIMIGELVEAPIGFTASVMLKTSEIKPNWQKRRIVFKKLSWLLMGLVMATLLALIINAEYIREFLANTAASDVFATIADVVTRIVDFVATYQLVVLCSAILLFFLPILIQKKEGSVLNEVYGK